MNRYSKDNRKHLAGKEQDGTWGRRSVAILICLIVSALLFACSEPMTKTDEPALISLNSYIEADEATGYDGYGMIDVKMNSEKLRADLERNIRTAKGIDRLTEAEKITEIIGRQFYLSNTENLKNGDKVDIVWMDWEEEAAMLEQHYGIDLVYENFSIAVNGLKATEAVDPFSMLRVSFEGYDGYGKIQAESSNNYGFSYVFSKQDHLTNGDIIEAEVLLTVDESDETYTKRTGVRVTGRTAKYTVDGLAPLAEVDPFEYITVEYSGREPDGIALFSYNPPEGLFPDLTMVTDRFSGLSNGDIVTLKFSTVKEAEEYEPATGIRLKRLTGTFVIKGLPGYVTSLNGIPKSVMEKIDAKTAEWVQTNLQEELAGNAELSGIETAGHFLLVSSNGAKDNYFGVIHKVTLTDGKTKYTYYPFTFMVGFGMEKDGAYSMESEMMRSRFTVEIKTKKGKSVLYGAKSVEEIREGFLEPATQKFFDHFETDF